TNRGESLCVRPDTCVAGRPCHTGDPVEGSIPPRRCRQHGPSWEPGAVGRRHAGGRDLRVVVCCPLIRRLGMSVPLWLWLVTIAGFVGLVILDLVIVDRNPHSVGTAEAAKWVGFYVALAALFGRSVELRVGMKLRRCSSHIRPQL